MRVVHLTGHLSARAGGISDAVGHLAVAEAAEGFDVHMLGLADPGEPARQTLGTVTVHAVSVRGTHAYGYAPAMARTLAALAPDVLHVHGLWMHFSVVSSGWARRTGRPLVIAPHGMLDPWALRNAGLKKQAAAALYERRHVGRASVVHALTEDEEADIRAFGARAPAAVVPNGIDLPVPVVRPAPWAGLHDGARVLLFLGRLHPKKGLDALVEGFAHVIADGTADGWHLAVVGWDDGSEGALRARAADPALAGRLHLLGPMFGADKAAALAHADAFVLPSFSEGLPVAVLEAWAHGLPVVMTEACHLPEGFARGAAIQVDPESSSVADGIRELAAMTPDERAAMGERGRRLVGERFTWERVARELGGVYRWVLGQGPRPLTIAAAVA